MKKEVGGVDKKIPCVIDLVKATVWNTKIIVKTEAVNQRFPRKRCSENMQQIYRRTPVPKIDFNKVASISKIKIKSLKLVKLKRNNFNLIIITSMSLLKN